MSNKSGTSSQVISLPKGGGALQGIGETFSPDLHTGTGNFSVPIALPTGRNGFQPELNLVYSSGNGNGPFGLGWNLSIPGISRKTAKGVPRYKDQADNLVERDTFILSGAEDLVPVVEGEGVTRYRPRTEGLFAHLEHYHGRENNYWLVRSKDGLVSTYGTPASADGDPAVIADPADRSKVFAWKLTRTEDPFGNHILYDYERDLDKTEDSHWDQLYLKRIRYVDYEADSGVAQYLVSVTFETETLPERYAEAIPDVLRIYPFSEFRVGFEVRTRKRYTRIRVETHADQTHLVRTYDLIYLDQTVTAEELEQNPDLRRRLPRNGISVLRRIQVTGHDGDHTEQLPPLEFGYSVFEPEGRNFFPLEGDLPTRSLANPELELADLFGNGLPDLIQMNGTVQYWRNLGNGRFAGPRLMAEAPAGLQLGEPGVQLIDTNGDGRIDLMVSDGEQAGYYSLRFDGLWDRRAYQRYKIAPTFNLADPEVKLVDLDGDGVTDAIRSGIRMEYYFSDQHEGWTRTRVVDRQQSDSFPNVNFSDPYIKWGDMSGDGLQDVIRVHDGNCEYWPSLGHGDWGPRIIMKNTPRFPNGYNPQRILVGEVDGDGLADMVYVDHYDVTLWLNQSGNGWSAPIKIIGTPPLTDVDGVRLVDMLGEGISGVLWSRDAGGVIRDTMFFLDFTGGVKPYVLNEMNNNMGAITRVGYSASTQFYVADAQHRDTRWLTSLPFPVQVVTCVEVIDQISKGKLTTEYKYHHGYWDGAEREFRGFGLVEQFDTETFEVYNGSGLGLSFKPLYGLSSSP